MKRTPRLTQHIAIGTLERGARDDGATVARKERRHASAQCLEPGSTIVIGQRDARVHLFAVGARVEFVAFDEFKIQTPRQRLGNGGLAGAGDSHDGTRIVISNVVP